MICPICGAEVRDGLGYCSKCGNSVTSASYQQPVQPRQPQMPPMPSQYQVPPGYQMPQQSVNNYPGQMNYPPNYNNYNMNINNTGNNNASRGGVVPGLGLGIASMVLGIISIFWMFVPFAALPFSFLGAIFGFIASGVARSANRKNGFAVAGIVCSLIVLVLATILLVVGISFLDYMF